MSSPLDPGDYERLEHESWITRDIADAAGLRRVTHEEALQIVGKFQQDQAGIVFPYHNPLSPYPVLQRIRVDRPPLESKNGHLKATRKYLQGIGTRPRLYLPPGVTEQSLSDSRSIVVTEGEKKCLALWRLATEGTVEPQFLPVALGGVWNWRGQIGLAEKATGGHAPQKGVIPDLDLFPWPHCRVIILFDANASTSYPVRHARQELGLELAHRGAMVYVAEIPTDKDVNGIDDYLARYGPGEANRLLAAAAPFAAKWKELLLRNQKRVAIANEANAITALRFDPVWFGVLAFNAFSLRLILRRPPPWEKGEEWKQQEWSDYDSIRTSEWLQRKAINVTKSIAHHATLTVARENAVHPVRDYFERLAWNGNPRLNRLFSHYFGAETDDPRYLDLVSARFLISGVARIFEPGAKADCLPILEGEQGIQKSAALEILAGKEWFADDLPDLHSKDAALQLQGKLIVEISELDRLSRSANETAKAFLSRKTDRFLPPYGHHAEDIPRQNIFAGTVNRYEYLTDETGGRRFWPVDCGAIRLEELARDRDQLWAEAVRRYRTGERWWFEKGEEEQLAIRAQECRFDADPWEPLVAQYVGTAGEKTVTIAEILDHCLYKPKENWIPTDKRRVSAALRHLGFRRYRPREGDGSRPYSYRRSGPSGLSEW